MLGNANPVGYYHGLSRPIGKNIECLCDHPGCGNAIDRGELFACGGTHGQNDYSCGGYFCGEHLFKDVPVGESYAEVCGACYGKWAGVRNGTAVSVWRRQLKRLRGF